MRILVAEKLSPRKYKTPEGYLICQDAILARTGKQTYLNREVYGDSIDNPDKEIEIDRPEAEVFSDKTLASFENKPVTIEHPDEDVNIDNHNFYSVGFVRDIKRGIDDGKPVMIGTLVVTNPDAVADIENGKLLELSCGYDCDIIDNAQTNIRGNHVALCEHGRAGNARIVDSVKDGKRLPADVRKNIQKFLVHKSTFIKNKDYDISDFIQEFERMTRLWVEFPLKIVRESIKGWNKMGDGMMRKDYAFSIEGYDDKFLVSLYAKPDTYETTELNAYFTDSLHDVYNKFEHETDKDYLKSALHEMYRYESNWSYLSRNERQNISPGGISELRQMIKFAEKRLAELKMKDAANGTCHHYEICYIDNGDICVVIEARSEAEAIRKFRKMYGMYHIEHVKCVDSDIMQINQKKHIGDARVAASGEHNDIGNNWYGYLSVDHPKLGEFYVSVRLKGRRYEVQLDGTGWNFIKSKGYTPEQKQWIVRHKQELENVRSNATIDDTIDDINDCKTNDIRQTNTAGTDKIIYVMQSDIDKNLYFYIGKTFSMKEGEFGYTKFEMGTDSPEKIRNELIKNGWHQVARGPATFIDENPYKESNECLKEHEQTHNNVGDLAKMKFTFSTNLAAFERAIINNDKREFDAMSNIFEKDLDDYRAWKDRLDASDKANVKHVVEKINARLRASQISKQFKLDDSTYSEVTNELRSELKDTKLFVQKAMKAIKVIKEIK